MKETLEEAAERIYPKQKFCASYYGYMELREQEAFENGAKWQKERSYSEEEVYNILVEHTIELFKGEPKTLDDFFEQFKKK